MFRATKSLDQAYVQNTTFRFFDLMNGKKAELQEQRVVMMEPSVWTNKWLPFLGARERHVI